MRVNGGVSNSGTAADITVEATQGWKVTLTVHHGDHNYSTEVVAVLSARESRALANWLNSSAELAEMDVVR